MKQRKVEISIIMACCNSSRYLPEAIQSVLGQTFGDWELILIDDCSTDDTFDIAERYRTQDDRISIVSLPVHSGPATARNTGIHSARGDWLGILDSDDVADRYRFHEQMQLARGAQGLVLVGSNAVSIDAESREIMHHTYPSRHRALVKRLRSGRSFPPHSSMLYKRSAFLQLAGFNSRYALSQDADLWFRMAETGEIASVDKPLVKIRKHAQNISNSRGGMLQATFGMAAAICHFLRRRGFPDPSAAPDESSWKSFLSWTERRMTEEAMFAKGQVWGVARAEYFTTQNRLAGAYGFAIALARSGHACALLRQKFLGSSLARRLATEWSNR